MDRRDVLKLLSLSALAVAGGGLLTACGEQTDSGPAPSRSSATAGADGLELVAADVPRAAADPEAIAATVAAMQMTGGALFGAFAGEPGNLALSPYSIAVALAMTTNGARGETREQMEIGIGGQAVEEANAGLNALTTYVESLAGTRKTVDGEQVELVLDTANALFGQRDKAWHEPFLETLAASYGTGMNVVDWAGATEDARRTVNEWTAERTRDKVPEILPQGVVDSLTRLVLVNTLYLDAPWAAPFAEGLTADGDFTLLDGEIVSTPLMRSSEPIGAAVREGRGWQSVSLPYAGGEVAMTVVLPDADAYADVEAAIVAGALADHLPAPGSQQKQVQVTLPSFTFRSDASLKDALVGLGVEAPFDPTRADFHDMTDDQDLYVAAVLHQVFVAVDEAGTEAAAATAVVMSTYSLPMVDLALVVDRPFLFAIHDVEHGTPLFLGRVVDPRSDA